jgi:hypothetical protein
MLFLLCFLTVLLLLNFFHENGYSTLQNLPDKNGRAGSEGAEQVFVSGIKLPLSNRGKTNNQSSVKIVELPIPSYNCPFFYSNSQDRR